MTRRADTAIDAWFAARGWRAFPFQRRVWQAVAAGESGLLHATTGAGKTYAVWLAALRAALVSSSTVAEPVASRPGSRRAPSGRSPSRADGSRWPGITDTVPLSVVWITPMRALAADTLRALVEPLAALGIGWEIGARTGDTSSSERQRQARRLPAALVTTPESLSLMLARADAAEQLGTVRMVVVDEWHELMGNKRGVQLQLALARLRRYNPRLIVWGLSATLGNLEHAMHVLLPWGGGRLVRGAVPKRLVVDTLLPPGTERFPWGGHLGIRMLAPVVAEIEASRSCLVFTNTRSQAELWYQALLDTRPDWAGVIALHHGSLSREVRDWVETGLKQGSLRAVVCTSSLDLGVDFSPVERVLQVGSPKGVARLMQRAGRSGHSPGRPSRVTVVPTNALEVIEGVAARTAIIDGRIEPRDAPDKPLDVLVQHLVTVALGGGFRADELRDEVRGCHAYRALTDDEWQWALDFVVRGGASLGAYPQYHRVVVDDDGIHRVPDRTIARRHRMSIGTIVSDASMQVRYLTGGLIGTIEESFIARLHRGDRFLFGGKVLELVRTHELTAWVRRATARRGAVPRWGGGKMPLSSELADSVLLLLGAAAEGRFDGPEMRFVQPLLELQHRVSRLPQPGQLVLERLRSREGWHLFAYPLAGRNVHIGLASLIGWRATRDAPATFSIAVNDYGFELLSAQPVDWSALVAGRLFDTSQLLDDVLASLNSGELAQRRFREIARIAGLVFQGYPGAPTGARQLQASASLFYEVFRKHDADNLLLEQARREVLRQELEVERLRATLERLAGWQVVEREIERPTPFAFPLLVERLREQLSTEKLTERIARMVGELEAAADAQSVGRGQKKKLLM